jgi:holliday junction DNA helicase RuvB
MSVITDIVAAYASGQVDLNYARESMRQVKVKPYEKDSPYVETYFLPDEGTVAELSFACRHYDLSPQEYEAFRKSLYANPVGQSVVDLNPAESPETSEAPETPAEESKTLDPDPISILDLLAPDEDDDFERELAPSSKDSRDSKDSKDSRDYPLRKRLVALLKHYAPTHDTGTGQEVHDPTGGGGAGDSQDSRDSKDSSDSKPWSTAPSELRAAGRVERPSSFDQIIGQEGVTERLKIMAQAARNQDRQLDHVLLTGPPGLGKTTLAKVLGKEMEANVHTITGPRLRTVDELANVLSQLKEGDILFIDEIHAIPKQVQEILYPAMEDFEMDMTYQGRNIRAALPSFTLMGATTNPEGLLPPLRDRFGSVEQLDYYDSDDLAKIAQMTAKKQGIDLTDEAALSIANRSRGTPRAANRYVRRVQDVASALGHSSITPATVDQAFRIWEVDAKGLTRDDRAVLGILSQFGVGRPAGLNTLASMTGLPQEAIRDVIEPFLMRENLLQRTPSGRVITKEGLAHLQSTEFNKSGDVPYRIVKSDSSRNLVFGWANVSFTKNGQVLDRQGHMIDPEDLESGAYNFVVKYRTSGDEHAGEAFGELVESLVVTKDKVEKGGFPPEMLGHWWVGFRLPPEQWEKVVKGERSMFSIQGNAQLIPVD